MSYQRYQSENVFFSGSQSVYVYRSLDDFYTDANGYLANPNRHSRRTARFIAVEQHPCLDSAAAAQLLTGCLPPGDWRPRSDLNVTLASAWSAVLQGNGLRESDRQA